ncbi:MAG: hypothetical protein ABFC89_04240 [Methanospirillum sp.]
MTDDTMTVRVDPAVRAAIDDLVRRGEYESVDEFLNRAVLTFLRLEEIDVEGVPAGPHPFVVFFESPRGRALLREIVHEARGE